MRFFGTNHLDKNRESVPPECQMPVPFLCTGPHPLPLCLLLLPDQGRNNHTTKTQVSVSKLRCSLSPSFLCLPEARPFLALEPGKVLAGAGRRSTLVSAEPASMVWSRQAQNTLTSKRAWPSLSYHCSWPLSPNPYSSMYPWAPGTDFLSHIWHSFRHCQYLIQFGTFTFFLTLFVLYWSTADWQCGDSFRCTAEGLCPESYHLDKLEQVYLSHFYSSMEIPTRKRKYNIQRQQTFTATYHVGS